MSTPYGFCITKQGYALLARMLSSEQLEITRVMIGGGKPSEDANLMELETMIQPIALATSTLPITVGTTSSFVIEYRNDMGGELLEGETEAPPAGSGLSRDISINEFAVFANDPTKGEIMLYYGCLGDYPDSVKAYSPGDPVISRRYPVSITVVDGVQVVLDYAAGAYMTAEDIAEYCQRALLPKFGEIEKINGEAAPTESTVGIIGQKYTDTTNGDVYTCIAVSVGENGEPCYVWVPGNLGTLAEIRAAVAKMATNPKEPPTADEILLPGGATVSEAMGEIEPTSGEGAPTESTAGMIGQKYTDTTTGDVYTCIAVSAGEDGETSYIWVSGNLGTLKEIREKLHDISEALSNKAEAKAPEWYDLSLAESWSPYGRSGYCKDQFGFAYVYISVNHDTIITTNGNTYETIAVLPEGYRPEVNIMGVAIDTYSSQPLRMDIYATGIVMVRGTIDGRQWKTVNGFAIFPAG